MPFRISARNPWLATILLGCILTGCSQPLSAEIPSAPPPTESAVRVVQPSATFTPTHTPRATATQAKPALASPTSPASATPTTTPWQICSPLALNSLNELPQIISAPYKPPPKGHDERHQGVDFAYYRRKGRATILGEEVQSVLPGRVAAAIHDSFPFGNLVIVETPGDWLPVEWRQKLGLDDARSLYILYAHLQNPPEVALGDPVSACQGIGKAGKSGNAGQAHLHLETRLGPAAAAFTGMQYYVMEASEQERSNYLLWRTSGTFQHFDPMLLLTPDEAN